jgi:putative phosphoesterase
MPQVIADLDIGLISDTHGLIREEALGALDGCRLIIHAGDVGKHYVLDALREVAPVVAVRGNIDIGEWAWDLPLTESIELNGSLLHVLHDVEKLDLDPAAAGYTAVIFGHSHLPCFEQRKGVYFINPGSAGPRRFNLPVSVARLSLSAPHPNVSFFHLTT